MKQKTEFLDLKKLKYELKSNKTIRVEKAKVKPSTCKVTFTYLKKLNEDIKSHGVTQQNNAFRTLKALEDLDLNPGLIMYNYYLQGKCHYLNFKRSDSLESIENAVECYRKVFQTARRFRVKAKNPKYHFKYAESIHKLSKHVFCLFKQNELQNKAYLIAIHSGKLFPESQSLSWLRRDILDS
jgi:hypothetical protein